MRILGIDPGLQKTGWGVIESEGSRLKFIACGTLTSDPSAALSTRLKTLSQALEQVLISYRPAAAAMEETFVNKNALSSLKLGHARGALMVTLAQAGLDVEEYAATLVKKSVCGAGRAEKEQIARMVKMLLPQADFTTLDAADALAVAICHSQHAAYRRLAVPVLS